VGCSFSKIVIIPDRDHLLIELASDLGHSWLFQIDHPSMELNPCCFQCMLIVLRPSFEVVKEGWVLHFVSGYRRLDGPLNLFQSNEFYLNLT